NGTAGNDIADGVSPFIIFGGNDTLNGGGGDDDLDGAGGDDTITGGTGNDLIAGGGGSDVAAFAGPVQNFDFGLAGSNPTVTDLIGAEGTDTLSSIETLRFNGVNYSLVNGTNGGATTNGNGSANIILGQGGADTLNGNGGNDVLV